MTTKISYLTLLALLCSPLTSAQTENSNAEQPSSHVTCRAHNLTLNLTTDQYASETSWEIKNKPLTGYLCG